MPQSVSDLAGRLYAELYDVAVSDWPGEIDFYLGLASEATRAGGAILEIACGTGRIALRLEQAGAPVVGLDLSPAMLDRARSKSVGLSRVRWVEGDMRAFDLNQTFALAIIPGHSFQNLITPEDQLACLGCIRRHLMPGGKLIVHLDHQDIGWLAAISGDERGVLGSPRTLIRPQTGRAIRRSHVWSYARAAQTATLRTVYEEIDGDGEIAGRWELGPVPLHCVFRFEMEHLLARAGYVVDAVYGDFWRGELSDNSAEMVWAAHKP